MRKEVDEQSGVTQYADVCEYEDRTWHFIVREGGSVSLYYLPEGLSAVAMIFDSLDHKPLNDTTIAIRQQIEELRDGLTYFLMKCV